VDLTPPECTTGFIGRLKQLFQLHPGDRPVILQLVVEGERTRLRLGEECCVDASPALLGELRRLLGPGAIYDAVGRQERGSVPVPVAVGPPA
jgi:DNA polymerase-3 subunit alpha